MVCQGKPARAGPFARGARWFRAAWAEADGIEERVAGRRGTPGLAPIRAIAFRKRRWWGFMRGHYSPDRGRSRGRRRSLEGRAGFAPLGWRRTGSGKAAGRRGTPGLATFGLFQSGKKWVDSIQEKTISTSGNGILQVSQLGFEGGYLVAFEGQQKLDSWHTGKLGSSSR